MAPDGYNGMIKLAVSLDYEGKILIINILDHNETPEFGDVIHQDNSDWLKNFNGKTSTDISGIDQISGASVSSIAVTTADHKKSGIFIKEKKIDYGNKRQEPDYDHKRSIPGYRIPKKSIYLTRLIGLSPLLAISYSLTLSLAMGVVFFIVFTLTSLLVSATRYLIPPPAALACYVLITATIVTVIDLLMQAWYPDLRSIIGLYLPIVAANCLIIDRTTVFASQNTIMSSLKDSDFSQPCRLIGADLARIFQRINWLWKFIKRHAFIDR